MLNPIRHCKVKVNKIIKRYALIHIKYNLQGSSCIYRELDSIL